MAFYDVLDESLRRCDIEGDLGLASLTFIPVCNHDENKSHSEEKSKIHHFDYSVRKLNELSEKDLHHMGNGCLIIDSQSLTREQCK